MDYSQGMEAASAAGSFIGTLFGSIFGFVIAVIPMWFMFKKAGQEGWYAIIPVFNTYKMVEIADGKGIKFLLLFIPFVNIVYSIMLMVRLAKAFGKSTGFAVGLIFLSPIFFYILAFDSSAYIGPQGVPAAGSYAPPQGYAAQPQYVPNQGYNPGQGYDPNQGYNPNQTYNPNQGGDPNQTFGQDNDPNNFR